MSSDSRFSGVMERTRLTQRLFLWRCSEVVEGLSGEQCRRVGSYRAPLVSQTREGWVKGNQRGLGQLHTAQITQYQLVGLGQAIAPGDPGAHAQDALVQP